MPRTKLNKNGLMKRNRRNSLDEKKEEFIREYEIEGTNIFSFLIYFKMELLIVHYLQWKI